MQLVVERTLALAMQGKMIVSHAFSLCDGDAAVDPLLERIAEAGIGLAMVAPGNVEPLPLGRIVDLGIGICLGQDGVRDLWSPWGDADMLARAGLMAWRAGYRRDDDIARCVAPNRIDRTIELLLLDEPIEAQLRELIETQLEFPTGAARRRATSRARERLANDLVVRRVFGIVCSATVAQQPAA